MHHFFVDPSSIEEGIVRIVAVTVASDGSV